MPVPFFLSLDGIDGTGKSTQIRLLAEWLRGQGREVTCCVDPGGTPLGTQLREILLLQHRDISPMAEALLFMASRAELLHQVIRPALARGEIVISDRYLLANVVYQGYGVGLDVAGLWTMGRLAAGGLEPDLTLVLDIPVELAQTRRGRDPDRLESRQREFHERVRHGFLQEAAQRPQAIRVVDARAGIDEIQQLIRAEVARGLAGNSRP